MRRCVKPKAKKMTRKIKKKHMSYPKSKYRTDDYIRYDRRIYYISSYIEPETYELYPTYPTLFRLPI
jgi:hypothetical protein